MIYYLAVCLSYNCNTDSCKRERWANRRTNIVLYVQIPFSFNNDYIIHVDLYTTPFDIRGKSRVWIHRLLVQRRQLASVCVNMVYSAFSTATIVSTASSYTRVPPSPASDYNVTKRSHSIFISSTSISEQKNGSQSTHQI